MTAVPTSRTVRIFLSSTFRDFGEERDLLVRRVFPELRRRCRERQVTLVDVDLRWGITEAEAQQGKVLPICLAEIDHARPYFIGLLGERYGWIPEPSHYAAELLECESWLREHQGGKSVTELEVLHGVLNNPAMAGQALFYFRDPAFAAGRGRDYGAESAKHRQKLQGLKDRIRHSGFPVVEDYLNPAAVAERIGADLWRIIDAQYPLAEVPDALALERQRHETYGASRLGLYLGGEAYLEALDEAHEQGQRWVLIRGASGGGKSALLSNWLETFKQQHPQTRLFVHHLGATSDAGEPDQLVRRWIQELARALGETAELPADPEKLFDELPVWLAKAAGLGRWVMVLDALDKLRSGRDLRWLPAFLPEGVQLVVSCLDGEVLEAAQRRQPWEREVAVKPLRQAQRRKLVRRYLGTYRKSLTTGQEKQVLGHPLSGNPLFLRTVLEELRVHGAHEELDQRITQLMGPPASKRPGEEPTVDDVFEHVLERVEADNEVADVRQTMGALWASRGGLAQDELLAVTGVAPARWAGVQLGLEELLLESGGRWTFAHDYARKAVQDRYLTRKADRRHHNVRLAKYFATIEANARVAEELPWQWEQAGEPEKLKECLTDRALFLALKARDEFELLGYWVRLGEDISREYEAAWPRWGLKDEAAADVALALGIFLSAAGYYTEFAIGLQQRCLEYRRHQLGAEHPDTLRSVGNLASLLLRKGDYDEAEPLYRRALAGFEKARGPEHPSTLNSLNGLAIVLKDKGDYDGAEPLYRRALAGQEKTLGPEHPHTLMSVNNLAILLSDKGDSAGAEPLYRRALTGFENALGAEHPHTLMSVNNLANLLKNEGDYDGAELLHRRALAGQEMALGPEHPDTLMSMHNLAKLLLRKGDYDGAEPLCRWALAGFEKTLGPEHPDTLGSVNILANLLKRIGDYDGAELLLRRALAGFEKAFGPEHLDTLIGLNNLANLLKIKGNCDEAEPLWHRALAGFEKALGPDHPSTLTSLNNLVNLLIEKGAYDEAEPLCRRVLAAEEKALGPEHPDTLMTVDNLARLLKSKGNYDEAELLYRRMLAHFEKSLGPDDTATLNSVNDLANLLHRKGDYDGAELLHRRALAGKEKALGPDDPFTLESVGNLARLLSAKGDYDEAESLYRRTLAGFEKALGPENPDTLLSVCNLADLLSDKGNHDEAKPLYHRALAGTEKALGPEHPDTLMRVNNLAGLLLLKGDYDEADPLCRRALAGFESALGAEHPDTLGSLGNLAFLLNATNRRAGALKLLREYAAKSPIALARVRYNLACYECLSGNLAEARRLIAAEITADPERKERALRDGDLEAIREYIRGLGPKPPAKRKRAAIARKRASAARKPPPRKKRR